MKKLEIWQKGNAKEGKEPALLATVDVAEHTYQSVSEKYGADVANELFADKVDSLAKSRIANRIRIAKENAENPKHADHGKPVDVQAVAQAAADEFEPIALRGEGDGTKRALGSVANLTERFNKGEIDIAAFVAGVQAATESVVKA